VVEVDLGYLPSNNATLDSYLPQAEIAFNSPFSLVFEVDATSGKCFSFGCRLKLKQTDSYVTFTDLLPSTLYGVRYVTTNDAGSANGTITLVTTLAPHQDFITLEFDADFNRVFGAEMSPLGT
jgi:hypothetical protein